MALSITSNERMSETFRGGEHDLRRTGLGLLYSVTRQRAPLPSGELAKDRAGIGEDETADRAMASDGKIKAARRCGHPLVVSVCLHIGFNGTPTALRKTPWCRFEKRAIWNQCPERHRSQDGV